MTGTEIERHTGNPVAIVDDHYLNRLPHLADTLARSSMCPDSFKHKRDDIEIVGWSLADNGLRLSINTLPQCYVVHGRPGYMAQLQTAMAAMHGVTIRPVGQACNEQSATVEVLLRDGSRHEVTFTMKEADAAGLTKPSKNGAPSMYKLWPTNMLVARATTRAIGWYCPAVKLGLAGTVDMDEINAVEAIDAEVVENDVPTGETGEMVSAAAAKRELLDAYVARGLTREQAIPCAKLLWESHGLSKSEPVLRSRLDLILALLTDTPDGTAAGETPAEVVTAEIVDDEQPDAEPVAYEYDEDEGTEF